MSAKTFFINNRSTSTTGHHAGGSWQRTLKNNFKALDAVRDILEWHNDGKRYRVDIVEHTALQDGVGAEFHTELGGRKGNGDRRGDAPEVVRAINTIIEWLASGKNFDITLTPRKRPPHTNPSCN